MHSNRLTVFGAQFLFQSKSLVNTSSQTLPFSIAVTKIDEVISEAKDNFENICSRKVFYVKQLRNMPFHVMLVYTSHSRN